MARRTAGRLGSGGGPGGRRFSPLHRDQSLRLQEDVGDHRHQCVTVQSSPRPALEVVEAKFFLQLLVRLLAGLARLDGGGQGTQGDVGGQVRQVVLPLAAGAAFANEPGLLTRHVLGTHGTGPLRRTIGDAHAQCREARREPSLGAAAP